MEVGDRITFDYRKQMTFVRALGAGGTGSTYLFKDDSIDMHFAIKKFDPKNGNDPKECYERFVDEVKILMKLIHPNIVRFYNAYLFPDAATGYIQMEFVQGVSIDQFSVTPFTKSWNDVFSDTISAFETLEINKILHRDIRPGNIMIDNGGTVKVIDFGFSKHYSSDWSIQNNSVLLNWPGTEPDEVRHDGVYNKSTEIYYLGKLFANVIKNNDSFNYRHIVDCMCERNSFSRYSSFAAIRKVMNASSADKELFDITQKEIYQRFANALLGCLAKFTGTYAIIDDPQKVSLNLKDLLEQSSLEMVVQNNSLLIDCFISSHEYRFNNYEIPTDNVRDFYNFFISLEEGYQELVLKNLKVRFSQVERETIYDEDIPF